MLFIPAPHHQRQSKKFAALNAARSQIQTFAYRLLVTFIISVRFDAVFIDIFSANFLQVCYMKLHVFFVARVHLHQF